MTTHYRHTQTGYVLIAILGGILVVSLILQIWFSRMGITGFCTWLVPMIMAVSLAMSYSMTVSVDNEALRFSLSFGWFQKRYPLNEIASTRTVTNHWLHGWGIHLVGIGWLYNVSGFQAVEITLNNGKKVRIGTDEPAALEAAIQQAKR